jgi:hypothetical protein
MRLMAMAAAAAAAVALSACASGGDDSVAPGALAEAASLTGAVKGANVDMSVTVTSPALGGKAVSFSGSGYQNLSGRAGTYTFDMSKIASLGGAKKLDPAKLKMQGIYLQRKIFMKSPLFGKLPGGKTWIGIDLSRALKSQGIDASALNQQSNPADFLGYLRGASGKVIRVGHESVRGTDTVHYKGNVDLRHVPGVDAQSARRLEQISGIRTMPVEVWIDSKKHVRRLRLQYSQKLPAGTPAAGQRMKLDETVEMYAFGPKPAVKQPPAKDVYDATGLAAKGTTAGG